MRSVVILAVASGKCVKRGGTIASQNSFPRDTHQESTEIETARGALINSSD
jgi:hypothetical protein